MIGGLLYTRLDRRGADPARVFATTLFLLLLDLALAVPLMDRVLYLEIATLGALGKSFATFQLASAAAAVLVVLPPTVLFGVSFPRWRRPLCATPPAWAARSAAPTW